MPGYAVTLLLTKRCKTNPILKILLAYLFSMLITGLTIYLSEIFFDNDISENKNLLLGVNALLLIAVVIYYRVHRIILPSGSDKHQIISIISNKLKIFKTQFFRIAGFWKSSFVTYYIYKLSLRRNNNRRSMVSSESNNTVHDWSIQRICIE